MDGKVVYGTQSVGGLAPEKWSVLVDVFEHAVFGFSIS